jgi:hypothetical protein
MNIYSRWPTLQRSGQTNFTWHINEEHHSQSMTMPAMRSNIIRGIWFHSTASKKQNRTPSRVRCLRHEVIHTSTLTFRPWQHPTYWATTINKANDLGYGLDGRRSYDASKEAHDPHIGAAEQSFHRKPWSLHGRAPMLETDAIGKWVDHHCQVLEPALEDIN